MLLRPFRILLDPQGGEGNGDGNGGGNGGGNAAQGGDHDKVVDLAKIADALTKKHGTPDSALMVLLNDNHAAREKNREKESRIGQLEDELKKLAPYRDLGEVSEIRKALGERDSYRTEVEGFRRAKLMADVAEVPGLNWNAKVLRDLADRDRLEVEITEGKEKGKDGKAVRVAIVKGEGDSATPLAEYAEQHWAEYLPILKKDGEKPRPIGTPHIARQPVPAGGGDRQGRPATVRSVF